LAFLGYDGLAPMPLAQTHSWLTAKRLRAHGIILAVCLWSVYLWNISTPGLRDRAGNLKGTDFLHFYVLGSLAREHRGTDLYNMQMQTALAAQRVPAAAGIRYLPLYPPQFSLLCAPFAVLPYYWALVLWLAASTLIYGVCSYAVWCACPNLRQYPLTVFILALALPAFWHLIAWGQTSAFALACFTLAFFAFRKRQEFLAGLALGCLMFKPQLGLAAGILFLITLRWKVIAGAFVSACAELAAAVVYYGFAPLREWLHMLVNAPKVFSLLEPRIYQTHSLRTFWDMLIPWPSISLVIFVVSGVLVCGLTVANWRRSTPLSSSLRFSSLLIASVLVAPHLTVYDLVILAPVFLLLSDWLVGQREIRIPAYFSVLLYLAFALPLVGPLARWTHIQLSVPVLAALLFAIWRIGRRGSGNKNLVSQSLSVAEQKT
jgi:hypothetical protein